MARDPYNDAVRRNFANPAHAGDLPAAGPRAITVEVAESEQGCRVVLTATAANGRLQAMRFRVFGCPHLIAAAEAIAARFEGRPVDALREFPLAELMDALAVPIEKTGRILLLEDAVRALAEALKRNRWNETGSNTTNDMTGHHGDITHRSRG